VEFQVLFDHLGSCAAVGSQFGAVLYGSSGRM
jgi:hypothetical protein